MQIYISSAIHEWLLQLPCGETGHPDVRIPVVEHVEASALADGERRVDPGEDARLAPGSKALNNRPVDLQEKVIATAEKT